MLGAEQLAALAARMRALNDRLSKPESQDGLNVKPGDDEYLVEI